MSICNAGTGHAGAGGAYGNGPGVGATGGAAGAPGNSPRGGLSEGGPPGNSPPGGASGDGRPGGGPPGGAGGEAGGQPGNSPGSGAGEDVAETAILDAARDCVLAFGVRRTSLSEVARRAHVSRPTLYRRWPDRTALVADVMTRELARVFGEAEVLEMAGQTVRQRMISRIVEVTRRLRVHPLLRKIVEVDPELLQPYIFDRFGTSQRMAITYMAGSLRSGQQEGSVRAGDTEAFARVVLLVVQSHVLSGRIAMDKIGEQELDAELAIMLDRYLSPGPPQ